MIPFNILTLIFSGHDPLTCTMDISTWPSTFGPRACRCFTSLVCYLRRYLPPRAGARCGEAVRQPAGADRIIKRVVCDKTFAKRGKKTEISLNEVKTVKKSKTLRVKNEITL